MRTTRCLFATLSLAFAVRLLAAQTLEHRPVPTPDSPAVNEAPNRGTSTLPPWKPVLAQGTNLQVEITRHYPMKAHEAIEGRLLHPVFIEGKLAVPENTLVHGTVLALEPDRKTRWHGRLRGDFTPFHTVQVQFDELVLPSGAVRISANQAADGAPVLHLAAAGATQQRSMIGRYWAQTKSQMHERVAYFTAPGLGDRALQMLYHQLPYHPERIEAHTMWSFELTAPLSLPDLPAFAQAPAPDPPTVKRKPETWSVNAMLTADLSSANAKPGDPVQAQVVEPVYDKDRQLVVPQGSVLVGKVTTAKAARSLGRNGKLRFTFQQVRFPEGNDQGVQGALGGATAASQHDLSLDAEGTITPKNQASVIAPILLTLLAGRALDEDNIAGNSAVASNGFGFVGRIVGVAAGNRNVAAGIGYYAAALSVYENFLRKGRDVVFPRNTRIEIETTPLRAPVLTPDKQASATPTR
jgi:hypothetical protein